METHTKIWAMTCITIIVSVVIVATTINVNTVGIGGVGAIDGSAITGGLSGIVTIAKNKKVKNV